MGSYASYFAILSLGWAIVWGGGVWYFHSRRTRGPLFRRLSRSRRIAFGIACVAIPCAYCLSYAPLMRIGLGPLDDLFVPVQWLIDHTPLREPLVLWANVWELPAETLLVASNSRLVSSYWGTAPAPVYAAGWIAFGIICCLAPPFIFEQLWHVLQTRVRRQGMSEHLA